MQYIIEKIPIDDVFKYDKLKYNSNNHWEDNIKPNDYNQVLEQTYLNKWINNFRQYKLIIINNSQHITWLKEVSKLCQVLRRFSTLYEDDLDDILKFYQHYDHLFENKSYFVRCENVSLKYGELGNVPFNNLKDILKACVTCCDTHTPILDDMTELHIYLFEWININPNLEFRVFVNNNKITAISQQHLYDRNQILYDISSKYNYVDNFEHCLTRNQKTLYDECVLNKRIFIESWCNIILFFFENTIRTNITHISSYVLDIALVNDKPYLIELNSFGKEYSSGSALYHWLIDEQKLYDNNNK
jgi:hypothetical protein